MHHSSIDPSLTPRSVIQMTMSCYFILIIYNTLFFYTYFNVLHTETLYRIILICIFLNYYQSKFTRYHILETLF